MGVRGGLAAKRERLVSIDVKLVSMPPAAQAVRRTARACNRGCGPVEYGRLVGDWQQHTRHSASHASAVATHTAAHLSAPCTSHNARTSKPQKQTHTPTNAQNKTLINRDGSGSTHSDHVCGGRGGPLQH